MIRLSGLWKHENGDGTFALTGSLGNGRIKITPNPYKDREADPDYILYIHEKEEKPT